MLFKPGIKDLKSILFYSGKFVLGFGFTLFFPAIVALLYGEFTMLLIFLISLLLCVIYWILTDILFFIKRELSWFSGMMIVTVTWFVGNLIGALPFYLSGFFGSYLDSFFETMSGFTTTGLTLFQDLDHAPYSLHFYRHMLQYLGGQGLILLSVAFLSKSLRGAIKVYMAEGREERIWPNIKATARSIWKVSNSYLALGSVSLFLILAFSGMPYDKSLLHSLYITMSAWGTGGFTPSSLSVQAYHSFLFEIVVIFLMILGGMNFIVHVAAWRGKQSELFQNIESKSFMLYTTISFIIVVLGLQISNIYFPAFERFRFAVFHLISAVTATGFSLIPVPVMAQNWNQFAMVGLLIAMAFGGYACSTAGGIKAIRVGLITKGIFHEIKRIINPEKSIIVTYYHHIKNNTLSDNQAKMASIITLSFTLTYFVGAVIGSYYGYGFLESLYESISATATVGLSYGITSPSMPVLMKIYYIVEMWAGRLEFMALFALGGYIVALVRGR